MKPKSDKWYKDCGGSKCPFCLSKDIEGQVGHEADADYVTIPVLCNKCGKEWDDIYTLSGYVERRQTCQK